MAGATTAGSAPHPRAEVREHPGLGQGLRVNRRFVNPAIEKELADRISLAAGANPEHARFVRHISGPRGADQDAVDIEKLVRAVCTCPEGGPISAGRSVAPPRLSQGAANPFQNCQASDGSA